MRDDAPLDVKAEFARERDEIVRELTAMCLSWDQNGLLCVTRADIAVLAGAIDLLKRAQVRQRR